MNLGIQKKNKITFSNNKVNLGNILIVEDESLVSWSIANALKKEGFKVTIVETGEQAIDLINLGEYDLVITDFKLPVKNGFEVAEYVKIKLPSIPVIMISAFQESKAMLEMFKDKIDFYIQKPFKLSDIVTAVKELIS
jgi:DNA-binding response OmpR family regulator